MLRVMIKWTFVSPVLQSVSGIAEVHETENISKWNLLAKFKVYCKPGQIGYSSFEGQGISDALFESIRPQIDLMVRSYMRGVILDEDTYCWIDLEEIDKARNHLSELHKRINSGDYIFEVVSTDNER